MVRGLHILPDSRCIERMYQDHYESNRTQTKNQTDSGIQGVSKMTREEQLSCLTDRPCDVCKFHTENGCDRWECVFEEEPDDCEDE